MSYVGEPFRHDIFVSYTHGDVSGDGRSPLKRWSQSFARELETELRALPGFGASLAVFLDQHYRPEQGVDPMAPLSEQLQQDIGASAIVTVLMSPQYLTSKWCAQERDWWRDKQLELQIAFEERIAVARIWPLAEQDGWPSLMVDGRGEPMVGFCFYDKANAELRPQPYEWPEAEENSKGPFRDELLNMVGWLRLKLNAVRSTLEERARARAEADKLSGTQPLLYLHGRADQAPAWEQTNDKLRQSGFAVMPSDPDPVESDPMKQEGLKRNRIEILKGCDALLLLGSPDGRAVDADLVVVGRQDRQSARAASKRLLPCALLDTVGAPIATAQRKGTARALQVDWIDGTHEPWVPDVQRWLVEKSTSLRDAS
jgi:hypothetical protein